ncbi:MAG TPA: right-handed parallel beta-helix repeat-containing protein [Sphingomicrobium sp.]|nr:right-handed parallel beta-helix repeat-containing protein [Sphingomicrobium sp.]
MTTYAVTTTAELMAAAQKAVGGDTISLASGTYAGVLLQNINPASAITITSADALHPAVLTDLNVVGSSNISLSNLTLRTGNDTTWYHFVVNDSSHVTMNHLVFDGPGMTPLQDTTGLLVRSSSDVTITNSEFKNLVFGVCFLENSRITVSDSYFHDLRSDGIRGGGNSQIVYTNNFFTDFHPNAIDHPDAIQLWTVSETNAVSDVLISGNVMVRGTTGAPFQGVFIRDEVGSLHYSNVTVTDNILLGGHYNGMTFDGVNNGLVTGNVVVGFPDQDSWIRTLNDGSLLDVYGNTASGLVTQADETIDNSLVAPVTDGGLALLNSWAASHPYVPGGLANWATVIADTGLGSGTGGTGTLPPPSLPATETVDGTAGNDTLTATASTHSTVHGLGGNDTITGNGFDSHLMGGTGNDHFFVKTLGDDVSELAGEGVDTVTTMVDYILGANLENLELTGSAHKGTGNGLANLITGTGGADQLSGLGGADRLVGGGGDDMLWGGAGKDAFIFDNSAVLGGDHDQIMDFSRGDKIDLRAIDAKFASLADDAFKLIGSQDFHHIAGELQVKSYGDGMMVSGDVNGDGFADFSIMVHGVKALGGSDFII